MQSNNSTRKILLASGGSISILAGASCFLVGMPAAALPGETVLTLLSSLVLCAVGAAMLRRIASNASMPLIAELPAAVSIAAEAPSAAHSKAPVSPEAKAFVDELMRLVAENPPSRRSPEEAAKAFGNMLAAGR